MSVNVVRWFEENNQSSDIIEFGHLRKAVRRALIANSYGDVEANIDLIFAHLKHSNRMATGNIAVNEKH